MEEDIPKISLSNEELRNQIEAVLFASGRRLGVDFLKEITEVNNAGRIRKALEEIRDWYEKNSGVLMLTEDAGLWKLNVREKYSDIVRKIISETELSKAVLETLSVIAWKAPVLQSEVVDIRTSQAYDHIKDLLEAGFIT
ncbi:SMC-Scp complex subunit ScpB, partial [Candidatus Woesearchaeota archaeon]|nr:SMC-Scp complex subunit ScpB [Candidatus Woesearchaeota archaeon]